VYVSDFLYDGVKVVQSAVKSDRKAIIAYTGIIKSSVAQTRRVCTFRKHTCAQHANFLVSVPDPVHIVDPDGDLQIEFDRLYGILSQLLDT
jgi:hypothetical protein